MTAVAARLLGTLAAAMLLTGVPAEGNPIAPAPEGWQADPLFRLALEQAPYSSAQATGAAYRLFDPRGSQIGPVVRRATLEPIALIEVPPIPGIYTVEGWLENEDGPVGPASTATLRFDDAAPAPPAPQDPERWLLGTEQAILRIDHPTGPFPLSGIRGYAISLDRGTGSTPCSKATWCSPEETDLDDGIEDDRVSLGLLPEGTTYARVVSVSGAGVASAVSTAVLEVDETRPSVSIHGIPSGWSAGPVPVAASASDQLSGMTAAGPTGPFTAIAVDGAAPSVTWGGRSTAWIAGGVHRIEAYARDAAGNLSGGDPEGPPPATAIVRIDEEPPRILFSRAQDPSEPERIEATLRDADSGVDPSRGSIMVRPAGTRARFEELPTRAIGGTLVAHWDSDSYPHGKYEFLAVGFDLAGNAGTGANRDRGGPMVLVNPLKRPVSLSGRPIGGRFAGRLRTIGGDSVANREVTVVETFAAGSQPRCRVTAARTREDGSFAVRLRPGPSREVTATFAGSPLLTRSSSAPKPLLVPTRVRLRASAREARVGGRPIVFSGRVSRSGAATATGLPVELQFRYPGAGWSEFRTLQADARGRFRYAYRFSDDDSRGIRFQFRAHVPGREGWPYEPGSSRPVAVTGR